MATAINCQPNSPTWSRIWIGTWPPNPSATPSGWPRRWPRCRQFYDAAFPRLNDVIAYCDKFPLDDLPEDARRR